MWTTLHMDAMRWVRKTGGMPGLGHRISLKNDIAATMAFFSTSRLPSVSAILDA